MPRCWRNPEGVDPLGHLASLLSYSPFRDAPCPSTDICPKELTRDMRGFFNSLLTRSLFGDGIPRSLLLRVSPAKPTLLLCDSDRFVK